MENFVKVYESKVIINDIKDPMLIIYDHLTLCVIDKKDYKKNVQVRLFNRNPNLPVVNINILNNILCKKFDTYNGKIIVYPFIDKYTQFGNLDQLDKLKKFTSNDNNFVGLNRFLMSPSQTIIFMKLNKKVDEYFVEYYVNKECIKNIKSGKKEINEKYILDLFEIIQEQKIKNECEDELTCILNNVVTENALDKVPLTQNVYQSLLKENTITLYNYQLNDIDWLNNIKNRIDSKIENTIEYDSNPYVIFDFGKDLVAPNIQETIYYQNRLIPGIRCSNNKQILEFNGGYLINSMGLGKTVTVLCFLLEKENALFNQFVKDTERLNCNYFFKRGAKAGKHCNNIINTKKSELFCTEHSKTPFIDKKVIEFNNLEFFNLNDFKYGKNFYKTNANLIICPTHLCDQWAKEYYTNFKTSLARRVLLVVTYDQFSNLTFGDVLFADIIIISYNFLLNVHYKKHRQNSSFKHCELNTLKQKQNFLLSKKFSFDMFYFNSVIMDEVHEIEKMPNHIKIENEITHIKSIYTWNISGTPFANGISGFLNGLKYITNVDVPTIKYQLNLYQYLTYNINKELVKSCSVLFRRNTKESIKNEFSGNIINNTLNKLEFTVPERNIYDGYNKGHPDKNHNFLIKLCCDPEINIETQHLIQNCKTLDEIQKVLLSFNKSKLDKSLKRIDSLKTDIEYVQNQLLLLEHNSEEAIDYRIEIGNYRRSMTTETKNYNDIKRVYDYLKNVVDNLKVAETCPICLDDTSEENLAITKCGHKFCWDCINEYIEETTKTSQTKCPKCNIQISTNDIYLLKEQQIIQEPENLNDELSDLVAKIKSTKLGNIIYYLKNELSDNNKKASKIIIFSQWDQLLDKLKTLLDKYKIKTSCVKGSVYQRKNAIETFSNFKSDTNIILLSSKNAASGINLTAANKIILVEPVYGTIEYRKDIENQSIGRCARLSQKRPIEVIRFIIKDTIEEEIYNSGYTFDPNSETLIENLSDTLQVLEL